MYALYNELHGEPLADVCPMHVSNCSASGVTVADTSVLRQLLTVNSKVRSGAVSVPGRLTLSDVSEVARPWSCLATCAVSGCPGEWPPLSDDTWRVLGFSEPSEPDDLAFAAAVATLLSGRVLLQGQFRAQISEPPSDLNATGVTSEPPPYVIDPERFVAATDEQEGPEFPPVGVQRMLLIEPPE